MTGCTSLQVVSATALQPTHLFHFCAAIVVSRSRVAVRAVASVSAASRSPAALEPFFVQPESYAQA